MHYIQYAGYVQGKCIGRKDTIEEAANMINNYILIKGLKEDVDYSLEKRIGRVFDFKEDNRIDVLIDRLEQFKREITNIKPLAKEIGFNDIEKILKTRPKQTKSSIKNSVFDFSEVEKLLAKDNLINVIADSLNMPRDYFKGVTHEEK